MKCRAFSFSLVVVLVEDCKFPSISGHGDEECGVSHRQWSVREDHMNRDAETIWGLEVEVNMSLTSFLTWLYSLLFSPWRAATWRRGVCFGSWFEDAAHRRREGMLTGVDCVDVEELGWTRKQLGQGMNLKAHIPEIYFLPHDSSS